MDPAHEVIECDALVIGAGLSGISALYRLRKQRLSVKIFESGADLGGVWHWNRYPGARVDSETPFFQLNIPEVWNSWHFTQRFPGQEELRRYFAHIDKVCDIRKDTYFKTHVNSLTWDESEGRWTANTDVGRVAKFKYLVLSSGLLHKKYSPEFPCIGDFQGAIYHSSSWPEDADLANKRVAIVGAGATAVQITQEIAKTASSLTVFIRRPSYCIPMQQRDLTAEEQSQWKAYYPKLFEAGRHSRAGFPYVRAGKKTLEVSPEERERYLNELWNRGAFNYLMCNYDDTLVNADANRLIYEFWKKKVRSRLSDPIKQELMAPTNPPFHFGTKRSPLEQDYYEMLDQEHVKIVSFQDQPLKIFTSSGMTLEDGSKFDFDVVVLATGFESFTGSMFNMGLKNRSGVDIKDAWREEIHTYLGILISDFPNAFMVYSPQAPTALSNGPTILECQVDLVVRMISRVEDCHGKSIEATRTAEKEWADLIESQAQRTLFGLTDSWWNRGNVPGAKSQSLSFIAGIDEYERLCREAIEAGKGFIIKD